MPPPSWIYPPTISSRRCSSATIPVLACWHRDRPIFEHVIGISLGDPSAVATMATSDERGVGHGPEVQISDVNHIDNACLS
ncbi:MAG TPA: hypothetical protein VF503_19765 [Sphingobium sp.]|uniref:hypothetical protein n=1 Tax=Sphingobium sp. TaxID=1912891 RepID=UPI002ED61C89